MSLPPPLTGPILLRALRIIVAMGLLFALIWSLPIWVPGFGAVQVDLMIELKVIAEGAAFGALLGATATSVVFGVIFLCQLIMRALQGRAREMLLSMYGLAIALIFALPAIYTHFFVVSFV